MDIQETVSGLTQELRRGTLILLVLGQLSQHRYGYQLVKRFNEQQIPMDANTLYPLLRRLEGQGLLESHWDTGESKPRKYYRITPQGRQVFEETRKIWREYTKKMETLMEEMP